MAGKPKAARRNATSRRKLAVAAMATLLAGAVPALAPPPATAAAGSALAWGSNAKGQLGEAAAGPFESRPVGVTDLDGRATAIAAGGAHNLAIRSDKAVVAWGANNDGQLGPNITSTSAAQKRPVVAVVPLDNYSLKAIAAGGGHSLALSSDGTVLAWGRNTDGQLGDGKSAGERPSSRPVPAKVKQASGSDLFNVNTSASRPIAAGNDHSLALLRDGSVVAWGANDVGQLGNGAVVPKGAGVPSSAVVVAGFVGTAYQLKVSAVAAGGDHSLALLQDGSVREWGESYDRPRPDGTPSSSQGAPITAPTPVQGFPGPVVAIAAGAHHSLALMADGTVWAWGSNAAGELGTGSFPAAGQAQSTAVPARVPGLSNVVAIAAGGDSGGGHSLALDETGRVFAWGAGTAGQLGDGTTADRSSPAPVTGLGGVTAIAAGGAHSLAVQAAVPSAPSNVTSRPGNATATIRWSPPSSLGSGPITGYVVTGNPKGSANVGPGVTSATVTGLTNGIAYRFTVAALNAAGLGPASQPSIVQTGIAEISPRSGASGCGVVTLLGDGFAGASRVDFGDRPAAFEVKSATEITATVPPHDPGPVDVVVTSPAGTSLLTGDSIFTYDDRPTLEALTPATGQSHGGTEVVIKGLRLCDTTGVSFGTEAAATFRVDSPTQITAVTPSHAPGVVGVTVHKAAGASPTSENTTFRFFEGDWLATGEMTDGVWLHTANLIAGNGCGETCGRVLVAGGTEGGLQVGRANRETAVSQLYDPATGEWLRTDPLRVARTQHTATTLKNGDVLVVGGAQRVDLSPRGGYDEQAVGVAERFVATEKRWISAGETSPRSRHTATLLPNGKVLVTGGVAGVPDPGFGGFDPALKSAQLYDPEANSWSDVADMSTARMYHTATLLKDGTVLVVGGTDGQEAFSSAQIYHPEPAGPGRWTDAGASSVGRILHTATALGDGRVLVAGGHVNGFTTDTAELFDPSAVSSSGVKGQFVPTGSMTTKHRGHTATLLPNGQALIAGGGTIDGGFGVGNDSAIAATDLYDPQSGTWYSGPPLVTARGSAAATLLPGGAVLVAGGHRQGGALRSAELFESLERPAPQVTRVAPGQGSTVHPTTVKIGGVGLFPAQAVWFGDSAAEIKSATDQEIVVVAPTRGQGTVEVRVQTPVGISRPSRSSTFIYADGAWDPTSPLQEARYLHTATLLDPPACHEASPPSNYPCGQVLVAGGTSDFATASASASAELYDPVMRTWRTIAPMTTGARFDHTATLLADGRVLIAGGRPEGGPTAPGLPTTELYDPAKGTWSKTTNDLTTGRFSHTATLLRDGKVLVAGGTTVELNRPSLASAELFDPETKIWSPAVPMGSGRQMHTATRLANGDVLVSAGLEGGSNTEVATPNAHPLDSAEIYSPDKGFWRRVGSLGVARYGHSSTLLSRQPCGTNCDKVLIVGGFQGTNDQLGQQSAELFDPSTGTWTPTVPPAVPRGGHSATLLDDGTVLVAGRAPSMPVTIPIVATRSAERFDPVDSTWRTTVPMLDERGAHGSVLLDGPLCRSGQVPAYCGSVLVAGGISSGAGDVPPPLRSAETFSPAPTVSEVMPESGPSLGGTEVAITGTGFGPASTVTFDGLPATNVKFESFRRLIAVAPRHAPGPVEVGVSNRAGTSAHVPPRLNHPFSYTVSAVPDQVTGLAASALSDSKIALTFRAPSSDGMFPGAGPPAERFIVKQSTTGFADAASIEAAPSICPASGCSFSPPAVGAELSLAVNDLTPDTTYYYAVIGLNEIGSGPASLAASATTLRATPAAPICAAVNAASGQVAYPKGYSLVGLPGETMVGSQSPRYGWFDQGAGGGYSVESSNEPVRAGRGYWAWFSCPSLVGLAGGSDSVRLELGAYHASMVGNPSSASEASMSGHDFAARWVPTLNNGAGGYQISGYRERQTLNIGEGVWAFNYQPNQITIVAIR